MVEHVEMESFEWDRMAVERVLRSSWRGEIEGRRWIVLYKPRARTSAQRVGQWGDLAIDGQCIDTNPAPERRLALPSLLQATKTEVAGKSPHRRLQTPTNRSPTAQPFIWINPAIRCRVRATQIECPIATPAQIHQAREAHPPGALIRSRSVRGWRVQGRGRVVSYMYPRRVTSRDPGTGRRIHFPGWGCLGSTLFRAGVGGSCGALCLDIFR